MLQISKPVASTQTALEAQSGTDLALSQDSYHSRSFQSEADDCENGDVKNGDSSVG